MRILIVEDSDSLRRTLKHGLENSGFAVDAVDNGNDGLSYVLSGVYDVVVLDLMLPGRDGLEVLREMRKAGCNTHVLIASARDQVQDRIAGLELGADDYLIKPFSFEELTARIKALIRRRFNDKQVVFKVDELTIDTASCEVRSGNGRIQVSPKEFSVLEALCRHRGNILSRNQLIDKTTGFDREISENAIDVVVCGLRKKLRDAGAPAVIQTKRGFGYFVEKDNDPIAEK
jgi:DNA-binding response OmpR family regulator